MLRLFGQPAFPRRTVGDVVTQEDLADFAKKQEVDSAVSGLASKAEVPKPANTDPMPERMAAAKGQEQTRYALEDHQHPRLTSAKNITLDAQGLATIMFDREFDEEPCFVPGYIGSFGDTPPQAWVESWIKTGAKWTGANIKGVRATNQAMTSTAPALLGISVLVGGQTVRPFNAPAAGVKVSATFLKPSS